MFLLKPSRLIILRKTGKRIRNLHAGTPKTQKQAVDPIQQLFIDKIREYKSKAGPGYKLYEPTIALERKRSEKIDQVARQHGGGLGIDMTKFPKLKFDEPKIDPINMTNE